MILRIYYNWIKWNPLSLDTNTINHTLSKFSTEKLYLAS
jgi:hypothetical protein